MFIVTILLANFPWPVSAQNKLATLTHKRILIHKKIYFHTAKSRIHRKSYKVLKAVINILKANPHLYIRIENHTDGAYRHRYGSKISHRRARSVRAYFIKKGIAASRLKARGYGPNRPIAPNKTWKGRAKNRRTEFHILPTPSLVILTKKRILTRQKIYFKLNSRTIMRRSYLLLDQIAALLQKHPKLRVRIENHRASHPSYRAYGKRITRIRARSVYRYLVRKGIAAHRLRYIGYGPDRPLTTNRTRQGRLKNMRTEFHIIPPKQRSRTTAPRPRPIPVRPPPKRRANPVQKAVKLLRITKDRLALKEKIYFYTNRSKLKPRSYKVLSQIAFLLHVQRKLHLRIEVSTHLRALHKYNSSLTKRRARAIRQFLINEGVARHRVQARGLGYAGKSSRRRVQFIVVKK